MADDKTRPDTTGQVDLDKAGEAHGVEPAQQFPPIGQPGREFFAREGRQRLA